MIDKLIAYGERNPGHLSAAGVVLLGAATFNIASGNADPEIIQALNRGDVEAAKTLVCEDPSTLDARAAMSEFSTAHSVLVASESSVAGNQFILAALRDVNAACAEPEDAAPSNNPTPKLAKETHGVPARTFQR